MKPVRAAAVTGLVLAVFALPVTAYALAGTDDDPGTPPATAHTKHPKATAPADPAETEESDEAGDAGTEGPDAHSAAGRAHAEAMKTWARCVAESASGPKTGIRTGPPKLACGDKPMGPGRAKHLAAGTGPFAPGRGATQKQKHATQHGRSSH